MRTVRLGDTWARTARSHGSKLFQYHKHDWFMILGLVVIVIVLNVISPFYRFVGKDMMTDLQYPLKANTVPFWAVPIYAIILPIVIFSVHYIRKKDLNDLHHAILGLLFAVLITAVITDSIKDGVGRPRPDFYWRCFPDGVPVYNNVTQDVICHGDPKVIKEGHKSFPSGHTSGVGPYAYFQFLTGENVNEMENIGQDVQHITSQDVHPDDRPYFTMDRAQIVENRNMAARGNGPFYDLETGRSGGQKDILSRESI